MIKSRWMNLAGHKARIEGARSVYKILVGKLDGKRLLGRPGCRWEDRSNIKMDPKQIGYKSVGWI
jgi:hypothetical protein